ncbi:MAG: hypothetical protein GY795_32175 [Desulfobacterales bacterium]|nr:hypothetical protein [Desulfobacterales bacterium]
MSNILIVESKNDEFFVRALIEHLNLPYVQVDKHPICYVNNFECLEGLNQKELETRLTALKNQLPKKDINAIGIILDHDGKREERINLINEAVHNVFVTQENILETGKFISATANVGGYNFFVKIACYLVNVNENGELETVLKSIKAPDYNGFWGGYFFSLTPPQIRYKNYPDYNGFWGGLPDSPSFRGKSKNRLRIF